MLNYCTNSSRSAFFPLNHLHKTILCRHTKRHIIQAKKKKKKKKNLKMKENIGLRVFITKDYNKKHYIKNIIN